MSVPARPWLPDFCNRSRTIWVVSIAQLLVVLFVIAPTNRIGLDISSFFAASAFSIWIGISISMLLCLAKDWLNRLPLATGIPLAMGIVFLFSGLTAAVVYALYKVIGIDLQGVGGVRFTLGTASTTVLIMALVIRYFYVSEHWMEQVNASARAEADALQARIKPHFLFNSMNIIAGLVRKDAKLAEQAVLDLSDLFRAALRAGEPDGTLAEEVQLARQYLAIEKLRLSDRLDVDWELDDPLPWTLPIPRLVIQPLVENAVLHGISRLPEGGRISISLVEQDDVLLIAVRNPCPPAGDAWRHSKGGAGHALRSISYRLLHRFGNRASLKAEPVDSVTFQCEIRIPIKV